MNSSNVLTLSKSRLAKVSSIITKRGLNIKALIKESFCLSPLDKLSAYWSFLSSNPNLCKHSLINVSSGVIFLSLRGYIILSYTVPLSKYGLWEVIVISVCFNPFQSIWLSSAGIKSRSNLHKLVLPHPL